VVDSTYLGIAPHFVHKTDLRSENRYSISLGELCTEL